MAKSELDFYSKCMAVSFDGWTPVTSRLPIFHPNKHVEVLVTLETPGGRRFVSTAKYNEENKCWVQFTDRRYEGYKVIAWMTKPAPFVPPEEQLRNRTRRY